MSDGPFKINPLVLLGVPTMEKRPLSWGWTENHYGLSFPLGCSMSRLRVQDAYVDDARNALVEQALTLKADYLMMVADDVYVPDNAFKQLWSHRAPIVTGVYWTKEYPSFPYLWRGLLKGPFLDWKVGEYLPVDFAGCDCLLVHTDVFRAIDPPWFSREWVFEDGQRPSDIATEDFYFFTKARAAGFVCMADTMVQCYHEDRHTSMLYGLQPGMPQTILSAPPDPADLPPNALVVADLGAGHASPPFPGATRVVRFDAREETRPDVVCDIRVIPHNHFGQYDIVHSRHVLEHFGAAEAPGLVQHWAKLVKVGGQLVICVPDIQCAMEDIIRAEQTGSASSNYSWDQIYGSQSYALDYHKNGFTARALEGLLKHIPNFGNVVVERNADETNLYGRATRLRDDAPYALGTVWREIEAREAAEARPLTDLAGDDGLGNLHLKNNQRETAEPPTNGHTDATIPARLLAGVEGD